VFSGSSGSGITDIIVAVTTTVAIVIGGIYIDREEFVYDLLHGPVKLLIGHVLDDFNEYVSGHFFGLDYLLALRKESLQNGEEPLIGFA
jgi:hypothetical protein